MAQEQENTSNYNRLITDIDTAILTLGNGLEELVYLRHQVVAQNYGMDMKELSDVLVKNGRMSVEELEIINRVEKRKKNHLAY